MVWHKYANIVLILDSDSIEIAYSMKYTHTHTLSLSLGGVENDSAISHTKCNIYVAVRVHGVRCISYSHQIRLFNFAIEAFIYLF